MLLKFPHRSLTAAREPLPLLRRNGQFQTPSSRAGILVQANTTFWLYGITFALAVTKNTIQRTRALEPSDPYMVTKIPSVPGISCPNSQGALILFS